ncbi:cell death-inducing p53-target protein 1-like [Echeneis naucrates]|uniref:cell death-inducing p53-target protein 1-like n=1 Tax=Echeneis naucrates TaxID=173247 RepID=UPI001113DB37|nr:cell death-inducing p53-target protein 1-like [Echeneis naucrates]
MASDKALKMRTAELEALSVKRRQLLERKKILSIFQELRKRAEFGQTEEAASNQHELDSIDDKLKELGERAAEVQKGLDIILSGDQKKNSMKEVKFTSTEKYEPAPEKNIFYVEAPPMTPAPKVILDMKKLPTCPCRTQCPQCQQFIVTEISTAVSSVTWMVCWMTALVGCVGGCCLIPFCMDSMKSTAHKCPKCRSTISTIKRL